MRIDIIGRFPWIRQEKGGTQLVPKQGSRPLKSSLKYCALILFTCSFVLGGAHIKSYPILTKSITSSTVPWALVKATEPTASGQQLRINGRLVRGAWQKRRELVGISDGAIANQFGVNLASTRNPNQQPINWFNLPNQGLLNLPAWHDQQYRYLDIAPLIEQHAWQVTPQGTVLDFRLPSSQITAIHQNHQSWGERLVLDLSQAAAWQVSSATNSITITLDAAADKRALSKFVSKFKSKIQHKPSTPLKDININSNAQRTTLTLTVTSYFYPHVWNLTHPNRLIIDIQPDPLIPKEILWTDGLQFQQRYISVNQDRFPIYTLDLETNHPNISLKPIGASPNRAAGTIPPVELALQWKTTALINGGFFNRNNQLPLGALRSNNHWISGPILGRGAIGWDDHGNIVMDRLTLKATVTANDQTHAIDTLNSGYVQAGIARYTEHWGSHYTTLIDHEIAITVHNNQVIQQRTLGTAGQDTVPIPAAGYLLILRAFNSAASVFSPGTTITLNQQPQPARFSQLPYILGAGPLLINQGKIVLNAEQEGFSHNFITGTAPRSVLGITPNGQTRLITIQNRIGGPGPTLAETAQIAQKLGCTEALNLDGGSSSSLYLSGQLINRSPHTAAHINNALGIFTSSTESELASHR